MAKLDQSVVSWPGKEGHSPSRIDLVSVCSMRKTLNSLPEPRADNSAPTCSESLILTKLTRLDEVKCYNVEKLAQVIG